MSRSMAGRLVRRAIAKETKQEPHHLRTTCKRRAQDGFACTSSWREASARWSGHVHVWYRLREGALGWFYTLSARRRPGGKPIITRAVRGGTSRVVLADASGALLGPLH
jgi:hypothetical protein